MLTLVLSALAVEPDRAWTGVGVQGIYSPPAEQGELDLVLSERVRWGLWEQDDLSVQLRLDARFTVDPFRSVTLETSRVREAGLHLSTPRLGVDVGRSPVAYGGPRLVDGVQVLGVGENWTAGFWLGEAPDLFTTRPAKRGGGGPILVRQIDQHQVSLVGELLLSDVGFDRAAVLVQGRSSLNRNLWVDTRLDLQAVSGGSPLADAALFVRWQPLPTFRLVAFYDAYSTQRYLATADRDPAIQRFTARSELLGLSEGLPQNTLDPTLYQLMGGSLRWASAGRLSLQLDARYRYHAEAARRYSRVGPRLGVQCTDALSLTVDYLVLDVDEKNRSELGLTVWYEPERPLAVDGSVRLQLIDGEPSYYTDGFVSWVAPQAGISAGAGVFVQGQQSGSYVDTAVGGLARVTWRLHGG